jgi:hypothetical protein
MKRKPVQPPQRPPSPEDEVVAREIIEEAKRSIMPVKPARGGKCVVCGSDCAPNSSEGLCWVCRRLKISAWRDVDQQASAQE